MIPVYQTRFGPKQGNCHAACIASILEVPIEEVPSPTPEELASSEAWQVYRERLQNEFLTPRNLYAIAFPSRMETGHGVSLDFVPPGYAILSGQSRRGECLHAVVAKDGEIIHDPHPNGAGVGEWHDWTVFVVLDPSQPVGK